MSLLTDTISGLVSIKLKPRQDGLTDQYNRILMMKTSILLSAFIGFNYFNDKVSCIVGNSDDMGGDFVGATCWIQGFYIYEDLRSRLGDSAYFGIPRNMDYDGVTAQGVLCSTTDRGLDIVEECVPMKKQFYLQYQYMPFLIASFAFLYYVPYMLFQVVNSDLESLKSAVKGDEETTAERLVESYFNPKVNNGTKMKYRVGMMVVIRILYLVVNLIVLLGLDSLFLGHYLSYGSDYIAATTQGVGLHEHNLKLRDVAKPGNVLIPAMGYCDVTEASRDVRNTRVNYHKVLCEISPHVLYQYVLLVFWFLIVVGIIMSVVGIVMTVSGQLVSFCVFLNSKEASRDLYRQLTSREVDYLEYIRKKNLVLYKEVLEKLHAARIRTPDKIQMNDYN